MKTTTVKIKQRIQRRGRGSVWAPKAFLDLGSRAAVDQALSRFVRSGFLRRLDRGVYDYPKLSPRFGRLTPTPDSVAQAVASATNSKVQVSGAKAANILGLSTQVPAKSIYLTSGPSRRIMLGKQTVQLKHTSPRQLQSPGTRAGLAFQAIRYLGPTGTDDRAIKKISAALSPRDKQALRKGVRQGPDWMRPVADKIAGPL